MINARFVPLEAKDFPCPRAAADRILRCPFKSNYLKTLDLLERELRRFFAVEVEIHAGFRYDQIRNDGMPKNSSGSPSHPGVILKFKDPRNDRWYSFPCDMFMVWQVNLHAIAYTLKALRDVERYGVARGDQQYSGFAQIEAPRAMSIDDAAAWLCEQTGHGKPEDVIRMVELYRSLYRTAAGRVHPDVVGTNDGRWSKLAEVKRLLDAHFGLGAAQVSR